MTLVDDAFVACEGEGQEVLLKFPFTVMSMTAQAKAIAGHRQRKDYAGHSQVFTYPFWSLPAVTAFADKYRIQVSSDVRALAESILARRDRAIRDSRRRDAARAELPNVRLGDKGRLIVDRPVDSQTPRFERDLELINYGCLTWESAAGAHVITPRCPEKLDKLFAEYGLVITDDAQRVLEREMERQDRTFDASWAGTGEHIDIPGLAEDVVIKDVQWAAIPWLIEHKRTFEASAPGFGKSLSGLSAVAVLNAYPLVVACLPNLVGNWIRELARFPSLNVFVARGYRPRPIPPHTDVVIIGTSALAHTLDKHEDLERREYPWVTRLRAIRPKALIVDEGHLARREEANRTQALLNLSRPVVERDGLIYFLTANPMESGKHIDLAAPLEILGRIDDFGGPDGYRNHFCAGRQTKYGPRFDGAHHPGELFYRLRSTGALMRRTDPDLLGLPPFQQYELRISAAQLDTKVMRRYREVELGITRHFADQVLAIASELGEGPDTLRVREAMQKGKAEQLRMLNELSKLIGQAKLPYVKQWISDQVAAGEKVVVAGHYRDVTAALAEEFGGLRIVGRQGEASIEHDKNIFQTDPNARVITLSAEAGGLGHTLTAARVGMAAELTWNTTALRQTAGRLYRIGQEAAVEFYVLIAEGTIDEYKYTVLQDKQQRNDAVLDGRSATGDVITGDEETIAAEVAWILAQNHLHGSGGRA